MFGSAQSFLAFLVALATVCGAVRVFGLNYIVQACRDFARQMGTFGCALFLCAFVMLAGFAVSKEPMRSSPSPLMPEWFTALGYSATDTDGDGIPDCWERWTRTNPRVADDTQDTDGDGVDNYAEFWHQCDPALADTDGDGYSDYVEIAGQAVGKAWYDPLVRATYVHEEPDTNANGVPDHWENTGYVYGFTDANGDGLPDGVPFPDVGGGNFDVAVTVTTSRSALLTWGDGVTNGIVLAPCTGLVVRARIAKAAETNIRLAAGLPNDGSDGLWDASYSVAWASGRNQQTEGNRIRLGDGSIIDIDGEATVSFRGEVVSVPMRGPGGDYPPSPIPLRLKWLDVNCTDGLCWEHDPGGFSAVAIYTNVAPPFAWYVNGYLVPDVYGDILGGYDIFGHWDGLDSPEVRCVATNGPLHETILVEDSDYAGMGHCPPSTTNIIGAAWTSTHNPTNATDHLPYTTNSVPYRWGLNCPETIVRTYCVGWDHGKVNTRNLPVLSLGDDFYKNTDHCLAVKWSKGGYIDLSSYLASPALEILSHLYFTVDDANSSGIFRFGDEPTDLDPDIYAVTVRRRDDDVVLDRLWIVVYSAEDETSYAKWKTDNPDISWTTNLPPVFSSIALSTNGASITPDSSTTYPHWNKPSASGTLLHHNATYGMRSEYVGEHGHQATYNENGCVITSTVAAGTADFKHPLSLVFPAWTVVREDHYRHDVVPFLRAMILDGNPCRYNNRYAPTNLNRPMLYQGANLDDYLTRRPPIPTGVTQR